jgi:hypothetical protein
LVNPKSLSKSKHGKNILDYNEEFKQLLNKTNHKGTSDYKVKEWGRA